MCVPSRRGARQGVERVVGQLRERRKMLNPTLVPHACRAVHTGDVPDHRRVPVQYRDAPDDIMFAHPGSDVHVLRAFIVKARRWLRAQINVCTCRLSRHLTSSMRPGSTISTSGRVMKTNLEIKKVPHQIELILNFT